MPDNVAATTEEVLAALEAAGQPGGQAAPPAASGEGAKPDVGQQGGKPAAPATEPTGVPLADVQKIVEQAIGSAFGTYQQQIQRTLQSQLDKRDSGIKAYLDERMKLVQKVADTAKNLNVDPNVSNALQQGILADTLKAIMEAGGGDEDEDDEPKPGYADQPPSQAELVDEWGDWFARAIGLDYGDAELKDIDYDGTPEEFIASIRDAGFKKAVRVAAEKTKSDDQDDVASPARIPGLGPLGGPAPKIRTERDPETLYERAAREVQRGPRGR